MLCSCNGLLKAVNKPESAAATAPFSCVPQPRGVGFVSHAGVSVRCCVACSERAEAEKVARAERQGQIRELLAELGESAHTLITKPGCC
jgi:hypothetical protein